MKSDSPAIAALTTLAILVAAAYAYTSPEAGRVPIGGLWVLNQDESQLAPQQPATEEDEGRPDPGAGRGPGGHGGGMGGFGGFGGFGGRPGGRPDESLIAQRRSLMALHRRPPASFSFVVRAEDGALVLTDVNGRVRTLLTDGKKYREPLPDGGAADRITKWKDGALVSELRGVGIKLVQRFQVEQSGDRLVVISTLEMSGRGDRQTSLRRVYDRADVGNLD